MTTRGTTFVKKLLLEVYFTKCLKKTEFWEFKLFKILSRESLGEIFRISLKGSLNDFQKSPACYPVFLN